MHESSPLNNLEKSAETTLTPENFNRPPKPIAELVAAPDFPRCALGEFVNIGGFTGVVAEIVKQSLKVTSAEGDTVSYNANGLRKIYGPKTPNVPSESTEQAGRPSAQSVPEKPQTQFSEQEIPPAMPQNEKVEEPQTNVIQEPDFNRPAKPIMDFAGRADFPQCTLGEHLNIGGYAGVVVEIVKQSLKVRSPEGRTMSFNANGLRKLYGPRVTAALENSPEMPVRSISLEEPSPKMETAPEPKPVELNYNQPIKVIRLFAGRRDFPECALGQFVDVRGFSGIVTEINGDSLDLRAEDGTVRSYGVETLRKLFGR